jgi:hypothetical protein
VASERTGEWAGGRTYVANEKTVFVIEKMRHGAGIAHRRTCPASEKRLPSWPCTDAQKRGVSVSSSPRNPLPVNFTRSPVNAGPARRFAPVAHRGWVTLR